MSLAPLGPRVLIRPVSPPTESESGLIVLPDEKYEAPDQLGEVVALGMGRECPIKHIQIDRLRAALEHLSLAAFDALVTIAAVPGTAVGGRETMQPLSDALDEARAVLTDTAAPHVLPHEVQIGDLVAFSPSAGQDLTVDDDRLIVMREDDLLAVIEPDKEQEPV